MTTVGDILDLLYNLDHVVVIYDHNVESSDNDGDLLWISTSHASIPRDVEDFGIFSLELEGDVFRIFADGDGIPNKYRYSDY